MSLFRNMPPVQTDVIDYLGLEECYHGLDSMSSTLARLSMLDLAVESFDEDLNETTESMINFSIESLIDGLGIEDEGKFALKEHSADDGFMKKVGKKAYNAFIIVVNKLVSLAERLVKWIKGIFGKKVKVPGEPEEVVVDATKFSESAADAVKDAPEETSEPVKKAVDEAIKVAKETKVDKTLSPEEMLKIIREKERRIAETLNSVKTETPADVEVVKKVKQAAKLNLKYAYAVKMLKSATYVKESDSTAGYYVKAGEIRFKAVGLFAKMTTNQDTGKAAPLDLTWYLNRYKVLGSKADLKRKDLMHFKSLFASNAGDPNWDVAGGELDAFVKSFASKECESVIQGVYQWTKDIKDIKQSLRKGVENEEVSALMKERTQVLGARIAAGGRITRVKSMLDSLMEKTLGNLVSVIVK